MCSLVLQYSIALGIEQKMEKEAAVWICSLHIVNKFFSSHGNGFEVVNKGRSKSVKKVLNIRVIIDGGIKIMSTRRYNRMN